MQFGSYRHTKAEIDLDKLSYNYKQVREFISPSTKFMGVVKADAYGHGAVEVGKHLESQGIDFLAVAVLDEAVELREAGVSCPILLFSPIEPETIPVAIEKDIAITVFSEEIAEAVNTYANKLKKTVSIHLKIDSGMGRIGARSKEEALRMAQLMTSDFIHFEGIYTHFAEAENTESPDYTHQQYAFFVSIIDFLKNNHFTFELHHCANTAATLLYPDYHMDMIRTGISLFGYHPDKTLEDKIDLKPIMKISTQAAAIKEVNQGETIGYGRTYATYQGEKIATLTIGYADGIPRELSNRWFLTSKGEKAKIVGRICMDQMMVEVTHIPDFTKDDELVFIGDPKAGYPSIYTMADMTDSFHYEILCGIGKRIPRVYVKRGEVEAKHNALLD
ncbi:alanine racemase [Alkalibacterium iburiense]|uniref:Alanine racemase n=1 Tax=Alkalibacterium iburiense TaxID=290589 RepID=A0ABN0X6X2_9LACT